MGMMSYVRVSRERDCLTYISVYCQSLAFPLVNVLRDAGLFEHPQQALPRLQAGRLVVVEVNE
jgi:hypothetical protein